MKLLDKIFILCFISFVGVSFFNKMKWIFHTQVTDRKNKITIAVIDQGLEKNHPYFKDFNIVNPYNVISHNDDISEIDSVFPLTHGTAMMSALGGTIKTALSLIKTDIEFQDFYFMPIKNDSFYKYKEREELEDHFIDSIQYAIDHGSNIINISSSSLRWNDGSISREYEVFKKAEDKNILIIIAAGNTSFDKDLFGHSLYKTLTNIIIVASNDDKGSLSSFSSFGKEVVDFSALGEHINVATVNKLNHEFSYERLHGTSISCAVTSALAAVILRNNASLKPYEVKEMLIRDLDYKKEFESKLAHPGILSLNHVMNHFR